MTRVSVFFLYSQCIDSVLPPPRRSWDPRGPCWPRSRSGESRWTWACGAFRELGQACARDCRYGCGGPDEERCSSLCHVVLGNEEPWLVQGVSPWWWAWRTSCQVLLINCFQKLIEKTPKKEKEKRETRGRRYTNSTPIEEGSIPSKLYRSHHSFQEHLNQTYSYV